MKRTTALICLVLLSSLASADPRLWETPLAVRQGAHMMWTQTTARNANGDVLVLWADARTGDVELYAQLISPNGVPIWSEGGVRVVTAENIQYEPAAVAVEGGWIVSWVDFRRPAGGVQYGQWVRAQKLDPNGNICWQQNDGTGVMVDNLPDSYVAWQSNHIVHDGSGGAIIAWAHNDLLTQRVMPDGSLGWTATLQITSNHSSPRDVQAAGDALGGLYLTWHDYYTGPSAAYAARVTPSGELPWGVNGIPVSVDAVQQYESRICADGSGGCIVAWSDGDGYQNPFFRAQRFNAEGQRLWSEDGSLIRQSQPTAYGSELQIAASYNGDACDGMIAVWRDERTNSCVSEIFAQKISLTGAAQWLENGVKLCGDAGGSAAQPTGSNRTNPILVSDNAGGAVAAWNDFRNLPLYAARPSLLYGGRILADGSLAWGDGGTLLSIGSNELIAAALQFNTNFLVVYDNSNYRNQSLRYQLIAPGGQIQNSDSGLTITAGRGYNAVAVQSVSLGGGRVALVWLDQEGGLYQGRLYYQIITSDGHVEKELQGAPLLARGVSDEVQISDFQLCPDAFGGFFVLARESRDTVQVSVAHVDNSGSVISNPAGQSIPNPPNTMGCYVSTCVSDGHGGCYVFLAAYDLTFYTDLYVIRLNSEGLPVWPDLVRVTEDDMDDLVLDQVTHPDGSCTVIRRNGPYTDYSLRATRIDIRGIIIYDVPVCEAASTGDRASAVTDGFGGVYVVWADTRSGNSERDIYASHIDVAGHEVWAHNGIVVCADSSVQGSPVIDKDAQGNLFIFWVDYRNNVDNDIYAQKLSPTGAALWNPAGLPVCTAARDQDELQIVSDGGSGVFAVWTDSRVVNASWGSYIFGTHLQGNGAPVDDPYWVAGGNAISDTVSDSQWQPVLCDDGAGGFLVAWLRQSENEHAGTYMNDIWAQRIRNITSAAESHPAVTYQFELAQNYPNPFNPTTIISFSLPQSGQTRLIVYNLLGEEVTRLTDRVMPAGQYRLSFTGKALSSGIYFYRLESPAGTLTKRMLLLK